MGYFLLFLMVVFGVVLSVGSGKFSANLHGERLCVFCHKRLKFTGSGHYATVCPRCGRDQTNRYDEPPLESWEW